MYLKNDCNRKNKRILNFKNIFRVFLDSFFDLMVVCGKMLRVRSEMVCIVWEDCDIMRKLVKYLYVISIWFLGMGN